MWLPLLDPGKIPFCPLTPVIFSLATSKIIQLLLENASVPGCKHRSVINIFDLKGVCSAGKLITALYCSLHLSFLLTPLPPPQLQLQSHISACSFIPSKVVSQARLTGSEHNVVAHGRDNADRKGRAQPPRWTGS